MDSFTDSLPYLLIIMGFILLVCLAAYGSCYAMTLAGTSSSLYSEKKSVLTHSYIATTMSTTIFFVSFILIMMICNKITDQYTISMAAAHTIAALILGFTSYVVGIVMGGISKDGFVKLQKNPKFSVSFLVMFATAEVLLLMAFLVALLLVFSKI